MSRRKRDRPSARDLMNELIPSLLRLHRKGKELKPRPSNAAGMALDAPRDKRSARHRPVGKMHRQSHQEALPRRILGAQKQTMAADVDRNEPTPRPTFGEVDDQSAAISWTSPLFFCFLAGAGHGLMTPGIVASRKRAQFAPSTDT